MNIILIKPLLGKDCDFILEPPLGLMYLSSFLKAKGYQNIKIIHMDVERMTLESLEKTIQDYHPDVLGLSALTAEAESMYQVAALTKRLLPETVIVAGGPHPTGYAVDSLKDGNVDIVVRGEGEEAFLEIIKNLGNKDVYAKIPGISFHSNGQVIQTPERSYIENLDQLPYPDWEAVSIKRYKNLRRMSRVIYRETAMPIFTSRGCPFRCIYCHNIFGKKFRAHSPSRVLGEIKILHTQFGIVNFEILDDIFNFDRQRTIDIMQGIIDSGLKLKLHFPNGVRGDMLDEELLDIFARAGTVFMSVAVETASLRLQEEIQKRINLSQVKKMIAYAAKKKIFVNGFFMLGFPGETFQEILRTIRFALSSRLHTAYFFFILPFEGTVLGECLQRNGKKTVSSHNTNTYGLLKSDSVNCSDFSNVQLRLIGVSAVILFLLNPVRITRLSRLLPNKKILWLYTIDMINRVFFNKRLT